MVHPFCILAASGGKFIRGSISIGVLGLKGSQHLHKLFLGGRHGKSQLIQPVLAYHSGVGGKRSHIRDSVDSAFPRRVIGADDIPHTLRHGIPQMGRLFRKQIRQIKERSVLYQISFHAVDRKEDIRHFTGGNF